MVHEWCLICQLVSFQMVGWKSSRFLMWTKLCLREFTRMLLLTSFSVFVHYAELCYKFSKQFRSTWIMALSLQQLNFGVQVPFRSTVYVTCGVCPPVRTPMICATETCVRQVLRRHGPRRCWRERWLILMVRMTYGDFACYVGFLQDFLLQAWSPTESMESPMEKHLRVGCPVDIDVLGWPEAWRCRSPQDHCERQTWKSSELVVSHDSCCCNKLLWNSRKVTTIAILCYSRHEWCQFQP